jgi:hypothetical protein
MCPSNPFDTFSRLKGFENTQGDRDENYFYISLSRVRVILQLCTVRT